MFHDLELHKNQVSLSEVPKPNQHASIPASDAVLTIGDLHANVIKLIHFLCSEQVLAVKNEDYLQLLYLYDKFYLIARKMNFILLGEKELTSIDNKYNELELESKTAKEESAELGAEITNIENDILNTTDAQRLAELMPLLEKKKYAFNYVDDEYENATRELDAAAEEFNNKVDEINAAEKDLQNYNLEELAIDLQKANELIGNLNVLSKPKIRLLGDDLADRGACDALILIMIAKLKQENIPYTIILSNHVMGFLERFYYDMGELRSLNAAAACSLDVLEFLCKKGILDAEKIKESVRNIYLPYLKLLDADLIDNGKGIIIYGHAGGDLPHIEAYAEKFSIPFKDTTPQELAHTIDLINAAFQKQIVEQGKIHECYDYQNCLNSNKFKDPIGFGLFNRDYSQLERPPAHPRYGYALRWSHGHDSKKKDIEDHVIVLDDEVGKYAMTGQQTIIQTKSNPGLVLEFCDEDITTTTSANPDNNNTNTTTSHSDNNSGKNKMRIGFLLSDPNSPTFSIGDFFPSEDKKRKLTGDDAIQSEECDEHDTKKGSSNDYNPETRPYKSSRH